MIDLHSHTTASDGQHSPSELVAMAKAAGVTHLAVTDHDTLGGLAEAREAAAREGLALIPGIEVSTSIARIDIHILGHFLQTDNPELARFTGQQGDERRRRMEAMVQKLNAMGLPITMADVEAEAGSDNLCRPHLARALLKKGYCKDMQDAFERFIGDGAPAFVAQERLSAKDAIAIIHRAGGTASLAHPGVDGMERYHVGLLKDVGLDGIEIFHSDHHPSIREKYLKIAAELDLVPTAGSDFHGTNISVNHKLGTVGMDPRDFEALKARAGGR